MKVDPHRYNEHPVEDTGASGLGGGNVDPEHQMHYTGKWPFGNPTNPRPDTHYPGDVELHSQTPSTGDGIFDNMFPFKLQFFIDDDPESDTFEKLQLRVYTGMLTVTINTFTYSKDKDTDTTYTISCDDYTGDPTTTVNTANHPTSGTVNTGEQAATATDEQAATDTDEQAATNTDTEATATTGATGGYTDYNGAPLITVSEVAQTGYGHTHAIASHSHTIQNHTHTVPSHYHEVPAHSHTVPAHSHTVPAHSHTVPAHLHTVNAHSHHMGDCTLTGTNNNIDHFLTVGGQPAIQGLAQIEPEGFAALTNELGQETGFRAQTLDETYGKVWLEWQVDTDQVGNAADQVIKNVKISVTPHVDDDPDTPEDESDNDSENDPAGILTVVGNAVSVTAGRVAPKTGTYYLHIGTTYDPDVEPADDADVEDINIKSVVQVIYENVYYSPFILPEYP